MTLSLMVKGSSGATKFAVSDSNFSNNSGIGVWLTHISPHPVMLRNVSVSYNSVGIQVEGVAAGVRITKSTVTGNSIGLQSDRSRADRELRRQHPRRQWDR